METSLTSNVSFKLTEIDKERLEEYCRIKKLTKSEILRRLSKPVIEMIRDADPIEINKYIN